MDLSDQKWTLDSPDNDKSVPGKVPSHAHVDLYNSDVIEDPYVPQTYPPPPHNNCEVF